MDVITTRMDTPITSRRVTMSAERRGVQRRAAARAKRGRMIDRCNTMLASPELRPSIILGVVDDDASRFLRREALDSTHRPPPVESLPGNKDLEEVMLPRRPSRSDLDD